MNLYEKLLLQTAVVKQLNLIIKKTREEALDDLDIGDMKRPRGLGTVSLPDPSPKAAVTDDDAFSEHCAATGGATVAVTVTGPMEEVLAVLDEHAPHLIGERTYLPEWLVKQELDRAEAGAQVPGVTVTVKDPTLYVSAKDPAMEEALQILAGTPLALEEGRP